LISGYLIYPSDIKNKFPNGYIYLKECETVLRNREKGKLKNDDHWFKYIYPKNLILPILFQSIFACLILLNSIPVVRFFQQHQLKNKHRPCLWQFLEIFLRKHRLP
jgi:hypothetical protein